jgi:opacity protein-like surface antigen
MFKFSMCLLLAFTACAQAQDMGGYYSNRKVLSGFVEYSNDSSHMLLGYAEGRKINAVGVSFQKRSFLGSGVAGSWLAEVRPYMSVTDPTMKAIALNFPEQPAYSSVITFTSPVPVNSPVSTKPENVILITHNQIYAGTATYIGGTRSTYVSGVSPLGYKLSLMPRRHIQPFVTGLAGLAFSPRDIPVFNSSAINYTFELGAGVEIFQTHSRSCQLEYRYHHLANTGGSNVSNPGIDSGVFKVSYSFGR